MKTLKQIGKEMRDEGWTFHTTSFSDFGPDNIYITASHPKGGRQSILEIPACQIQKEKIAEAVLLELRGKM